MPSLRLKAIIVSVGLDLPNFGKTDEPITKPLDSPIMRKSESTTRPIAQVPAG